MCLAAGLAGGLAACSGDPPGGETSAGPGGGGLPQATEVLRPGAPPLPGQSECRVEITTGIPIADAAHVPACSDVTYATNPPSGGDHEGTWAAYKKYEAPVRRENYVHNMEHGGVVLAYDCAGPCPDVVAALEKVMDETPADPTCEQAGQVPASRLLLTPDPELDAPVAAAAWGATYVATCVDPPSLRAFVDRHYGRGPEDTCAPGADVEAPGMDPCP